jgi:hypothetical protein
MKGNFHVRFLEGAELVTALCHSACDLKVAYYSVIYQLFKEIMGTQYLIII